MEDPDSDNLLSNLTLFDSSDSDHSTRSTRSSKLLQTESQFLLQKASWKPTNQTTQVSSPHATPSTYLPRTPDGDVCG